MVSFEELYAEHYGEVFRFAAFLTGDRSRAEDLAADTFVRAWAARGRIRQHTVRAYLLTITRNLYRDQLRRRRTAGVEVPVDGTIVDPHPGVAVKAEHASTLRWIRRRMHAVARGDRRALLLFVVREMSYQEIADALGVTVAAVKSRLSRARAALAAGSGPATEAGDHS